MRRLQSLGACEILSPIVAVLLLLLLTAIVIGVACGVVAISISQLSAALCRHLGFCPPDPSQSLVDAIIWDLRVPRVLTACAVGASLSLCGAVIQVLTRNPLADPYLLGIAPSASLGAVLMISLGASALAALGALSGAGLAIGMTLIASRMLESRSVNGLVLLGVALSASASSATSLLVFWASNGDSYREILGWLLGTLSGATWSAASFTWVALAISCPLLFVLTASMNALALGDGVATSLGLDVRATRFVLLAIATFLVGIVVSNCGSIGFVGLIVPHFARYLADGRTRYFLVLCMVIGALLMVVADVLSRTLFAPRELPVGVITALLGAPLLWIVVHREGPGRRS